MRLREVYLSDAEQLGVTATRIWNLDLSDPIAYLKIMFEAKSARTGGDCKLYLPKCVSKIEVVDGSDVLYSTNLCEALAVHLYGGNGMPFQQAWGTSDDTSIAMVELRFGRDDSDQEYMLDPKKFVNPQLKITYNFPVNATNWTVSQQFVSVIAMVAEGVATDPRGFFMTKHIYEWLTQAGATETIDMPRDYPYRLLLMRSHFCEYALWNYFTQVKMSCDIDKFVNFNMKVRDLAMQNHAYYNPQFMIGAGKGDGASAALIPHHFSWTHSAAFDFVPAGAAMVGHGGMVGLFIAYHQDAGADVDAATIISQGVWGDELWCSEVVRFGNLRDPEEWFDPTSYMSVRLMITQAVADDDRGGIIIQQARPY